MMRSLYSGVSGLRSHQTRMDVIGANIANVNTVGFKGSRVIFRDVLYQSYSNPAVPTDDPARGGTNPAQIGLGVMVSQVDVLNTRAGPMTTDKPTDLYVDGEGYFKVYAVDGNYYYTRVGDFGFDALGRLVDGNGNFVMGWCLDGAEMERDGLWDSVAENGIFPGGMDPQEDLGDMVININGDEMKYTAGMYEQISIGNDGVISAYDTSEGRLVILGQILLYKFPNNDGLQQVGNTYLMPTVSSGYPAVITPGLHGTGKIVTSRLEMSNVELAREFTDMIITQRGFQANSRIITVSDEMLQELVNLKR